MNYLSKTLSLVSIALLGTAIVFSMEEPDSPRSRSGKRNKQTQTATSSQIRENNDEDDEVLEVQFTTSSLFDLDLKVFHEIESKHLENLSEEEYACYRVLRTFRNLEHYRILSLPVFNLAKEGVDLAKEISGNTPNTTNLNLFLAFVNQLRSIDNSELKEEIQHATVLYHIEPLDTKDQICNLLNSMFKSDLSLINAIANECIKYKELQNNLKDPDLIRIVKEAEHIANKARDTVLHYLDLCTEATQWIDSVQPKFFTLQSPYLLDFPRIQSLYENMSSDLCKIAPIYEELQQYIFDHWHSFSIHRPKKQVVNGKEIITCLPFTSKELKRLTIQDIELMPDSLINTFTEESFCLFYALNTQCFMERSYQVLSKPYTLLNVILTPSTTSNNPQNRQIFLIDGQKIRDCLASLDLLKKTLEITMTEANTFNTPHTFRLQNIKSEKFCKAIKILEKSKINLCTEIQAPLKDAKALFDDLKNSIGLDPQSEKKSFSSTFTHVTQIYRQLESCRKKMLQFIQEIEASIETLWPDESDKELTKENKEQREKKSND